MICHAVANHETIYSVLPENLEDAVDDIDTDVQVRGCHYVATFVMCGVVSYKHGGRSECQYLIS